MYRYSRQGLTGRATIRTNLHPCPPPTHLLHQHNLHHIICALHTLFIYRICPASHPCKQLGGGNMSSVCVYSAFRYTYMFSKVLCIKEFWQRGGVETGCVGGTEYCSRERARASTCCVVLHVCIDFFFELTHIFEFACTFLIQTRFPC